MGAEVDWSATGGMAVAVANSGDPALDGARSIIQQISRDIGTGTTSYQAGPAAHLGISDLVALTRFNRTRNAARNGGGSGGGDYSTAGGPNQKTTGEKGLPGGGGGALPAQWFLIEANGAVAYVQLNAGVPQATLPAGANLVNPP